MVARSEIWLVTIVPNVLPVIEANRSGVEEECSESLGYICLSISGAALLSEHEDIRLAISDGFSGDMILCIPRSALDADIMGIFSYQLLQ